MSGIKDVAVAGLRKAPLPLVTPLVRRRIQRAQSDPVTVRTARNQMEFVVGAARPDADLDALALKHIEQVVWRRELRYRPAAITHQRIHGLEHLDVRGPEGGVIITGFHHARFDGVCGSIRNAGGPQDMQVAGNPEFFVEPMEPHVAAHKRVVEMGATMYDVTAGFRGLQDVIARNPFVWAFDMPGSTKVRFLGRTLGVSSAIARIAMAKQVPVVCVGQHQVGEWEQEVRLAAPIMPGDHDSPDTLLQAIMDAIEPSILAWPEAYDWPRPKFTHFDADGNKVEYQRDPGEPEH
jgi:lauroyl/myristoyl acyltransferase